VLLALVLFSLALLVVPSRLSLLVSRGYQT
jgi:hypothetical protein